MLPPNPACTGRKICRSRGEGIFYIPVERKTQRNPMKITVISRHRDDKPIVDEMPESPEDRLNLVELLRKEAGKFIYDGYPERFRRVVTVVRKKSR
jgi:hypothetical protein